ncbi:hypothetical protein Pmar_PMAR020729 [Perkinsus marinus ATCC 50983]|uniref:Uncharacterized protein n=1 Tax=Perkinsus marinus (strain ATCC 50983 / TXsc) TaxID=423536 RepID=C5KVY7_PERM5|nr:hypothetical protein Pmar_PMAR020729 [Perkinsus marinus ATCC 50983]EER11378.1 hypothetical protein Pmar_PMAR020729 [Perkinsus marinus ATCC 50983]|eukprot:XP_002779583.1 hypothetical protein Pmar_PMAR020729 [Perkinsus marinus ATCC 50983]
MSVFQYITQRVVASMREAMPCPHEAVYGFPLQSPLARWASSHNSTAPVNDDAIEKLIAHPNKKHKRAIRSACDKLRQRRERIMEDWRQLWQECKPQQANEPNEFDVGDKVLVWTQPSHKLDRMWREGEIIRRVGSRCYEVKFNGNRSQLYSADHLEAFLPNGVYNDDDNPKITDDELSGEPTLSTRSLRHTKFILWKDPQDSKTHYGKIERWTGNGQYMVHEYRLLDERLLPLWIGPDGKLSAIGNVAAFVRLSPRDVKKIKVDEVTNILLEESLDEVTP